MSNFFLPGLNAVLIHIPKTGGTSIRKGVFSGAIGPVYGYIPELWQNRFKFAFIREPIDRFLSCVSMFSYGTVDENGGVRRAARADFTVEKALSILDDMNLDFGENRRSIEERFLHHALPMTHTFNNLSSADFVGKFESIESDFLKICKVCSINNPPALPKLHVSKKRFSRDDLTPDQIVKLYHYYQEDYRFGNYKPPV